jgi:hypothetical protein
MPSLCKRKQGVLEKLCEIIVYSLILYTLDFSWKGLLLLIIEKLEHKNFMAFYCSVELQYQPRADGEYTTSVCISSIKIYTIFKARVEVIKINIE